MLIQIEVPDTVLTIPHYTKEDVMLDIAVALYQRQIYSLAKSARFAGLRNGVKITSQFDAILLPPSILSFSLNSPTIRLKR